MKINKQRPVLAHFFKKNNDLAGGLAALVIADTHHRVGGNGKVGKVLVADAGRRSQAVFVAPDFLVDIFQHARNISA